MTDYAGLLYERMATGSRRGHFYLYMELADLRFEQSWWITGWFSPNTEAPPSMYRYLYKLEGKHW